MRPSFFHHLHPPTIPALRPAWRYTLGAGGLAVFLSLVLVITGALEMFYYVPTPENAASLDPGADLSGPLRRPGAQPALLGCAIAGAWSS